MSRDKGARLIGSVGICRCTIHRGGVRGRGAGGNLLSGQEELRRFEGPTRAREKSSALIRMRATFPSIRRRVFHVQRNQAFPPLETNHPESLSASARRGKQETKAFGRSRFFHSDPESAPSLPGLSLFRKRLVEPTRTRVSGAGSPAKVPRAPGHPFPVIVRDLGARALRCSVPSCGLFVRKLHQIFVRPFLFISSNCSTNLSTNPAV